MQPEKKNRTIAVIEMAVVYLMILIIISFSATIISLGNTVAAKMLLSIAVYIAVTGTGLLAFLRRKASGLQLGFAKEKIGKQLIAGIAVFFVTFCLVVLIPLLIGISKTDVLSFKARSVPILLFYLLNALVCVGFGEEIVFRGYFYNRIKSIAKIPWLPMLGSALLFGFLHYPNTLNFANVAVTFLLGMFYGLCRWKFKNCSLLSLSIAHGLHDAAILLLSFYLL